MSHDPSSFTCLRCDARASRPGTCDACCSGVLVPTSELLPLGPVTAHRLLLLGPPDEMEPWGEDLRERSEELIVPVVSPARFTASWLGTTLVVVHRRCVEADPALLSRLRRWLPRLRPMVIDGSGRGADATVDYVASPAEILHIVRRAVVWSTA